MLQYLEFNEEITLKQGLRRSAGQDGFDHGQA
jgi:hypothetical protein